MHPAHPHQEQLGILRVLVCVAWADGQVSPGELGYLRGLCRRFDLSAAEEEEIMALTERPAGWEDFQRSLRALGELRRDPVSRESLVRWIEELVDVDQVRTPEEERHLGFLRAWAGSGSRDEAGDRPWQGMWRAARERIGTLSERLSSGSLASVLEQALRAHLPVSSSGGQTTQDQRHFVLLFGALIHRVIKADGVVRPEELERLRRILEVEFGFSEDELEQMLTLITRGVAGDADRQHLCAEFNRITEMEERLRLLTALFAVGLADGELSPAEEEEIRLIANYLWVETQEYVRVRLLALGKQMGSA